MKNSNENNSQRNMRKNVFLYYYKINIENDLIVSLGLNYWAIL